MADTWISHTFNLCKTWYPSLEGVFSIDLEKVQNEPLDQQYIDEWYSEADNENQEPMNSRSSSISHKWQLHHKQDGTQYITLTITGEVIW